jgi:hypothetical protein
MLEALNGKPIYVEDAYILFELRLKALIEWLDIQSGIKSAQVSKQDKLLT